MFEGRNDRHCNTFLAMWIFLVHVIANSDFTLQFCCCRFCTITLRSVCIKTRLGDSAMSVLPMQPASRHVGLELTFLFFYMLGLPRCGFYGFKRAVCWCETCEDVVITVIGGVDCEHIEILCFSLKLMAGHSDYTGCVHCLSLSVLAQFAVPFVLWILNLETSRIRFHRTWAARSNCCSWPVSGWSRQSFFVAWIWIIFESPKLQPMLCKSP